MKITTDDVISVFPKAKAAEAIEIAKCADILLGLAQQLKVDLPLDTAIWLSRSGSVRAGILKGSVSSIAAALILLAGDEICHITAHRHFNLETVIDDDLQFQPMDVKNWLGTLLWVCIMAYMVNSGRTRVWHASHSHRLQLAQEKMERELNFGKISQHKLREYRRSVEQLEAFRLFKKLGMINEDEEDIQERKKGGKAKFKHKPN